MKSIQMGLVIFVLLNISPGVAQELKRFELGVMGGFTGSGDIPVHTEEGITLGAIHVNNSHNASAAFAINLNELDAIEFFWQRQFTEARLTSEIAALLNLQDGSAIDLDIDQYHVNFIHHYRIPVSRTMPYMMAGLGATTYYTNRNGARDSGSFFSFSIGGGVKHFLTEQVGLRGELRWGPTIVSASGSNLLCKFGGTGADCLVHLKLTSQQQVDINGGLFIRF